MQRSRGFTLVELMIVVVILGVLAAIAIPNFVAMQNRAKEGSVKANMHTMQLSVEDHGIQSDGLYATDASDVVAVMPGAGAHFRNPFDQTSGLGASWENLGSPLATPTAVSGITSYADSNRASYAIKGFGRVAPLTLELAASN